jgi:putative sterol carrier protein
MALQYGNDEWVSAYVEWAEGKLNAAKPPYIMGSPEWVLAYERLVQGDDEYKEAAKTWEGTVVIHILPDADAGMDDDVYLFMDLWHGDCRFIRIVPSEVGESADFVITGEYSRWKAVMAKELDTIKGMMQGKLKLKGDLPTIVRAVKASARLVDLTAAIECVFSDESAEAANALRDVLAEFHEKFG